MLRKIVALPACCAALALLAGCGFDATLERFVDQAQQAELVRTAQLFCSNPEALERQFNAELFRASRALFSQLPRECPPEGASYRVTSFTFNQSTDGATTLRQEAAIIVAGAIDGAGPWTEFAIVTHQQGTGPRLITNWNVGRMTSPPPSVEYIRAWGGWVQTAWIGGTLLVLLIVGGTVIGVRAYRRRRDMALSPRS